MRTRALVEVVRVWLFAAVVVALGAWCAPLLFNAGKALAEVTSSRTTNGILEWLGAACQKTDFAGFFAAGQLVAAALLGMLWFVWRRRKKNETSASVTSVTSGESVESAETTESVESATPAPESAPESKVDETPKRRPPWLETIRGIWHGCAGFLLVGEVWLALAGALVLAGILLPHLPAEGWKSFAVRGLAESLALAVLLEILFRGWVMAVFLRAMRPAAAIGLNALLFALVLVAVAPHGIPVVDSEAGDAGFRLLRQLAWRMGEWQGLCQFLLPPLALGFVLAWARWRTGALWVPIGLHAGWRFALVAQAGLLGPAAIPFLTDKSLEQAFLPVLTIVLAGVAARRFTAKPGP